MQVRIGVVQSPREIEVEVGDGDVDQVTADIEKALEGDMRLLWLNDRRGRKVAVVTEKIAYVEIGSETGDRRVGFSAVQ